VTKTTYLSPSLQFGHVHATRRTLALGVPSPVDSLLTAGDTVTWLVVGMFVCCIWGLPWLVVVITCHLFGSFGSCWMCCPVAMICVPGGRLGTADMVDDGGPCWGTEVPDGDKPNWLWAPTESALAGINCTLPSPGIFWSGIAWILLKLGTWIMLLPARIAATPPACARFARLVAGITVTCWPWEPANVICWGWECPSITLCPAAGCWLWTVTWWLLVVSVPAELLARLGAGTVWNKCFIRFIDSWVI
jgi:hypothetical protein